MLTLNTINPKMINQKSESNNFSDLLVDKYRPKSYVDLISNEKTNRSILEWTKKVKSNKSKTIQKIAIFHGPPGSGKTTCAHIIAKHCGYKIVEINASDIRSIKEINNLIKNMVTNKAISFDNQPNLLLIDEIDGLFNNFFEIKKLTNKLEKIIRKSKTPIICTCNNLWAKALKPLRQISICFEFIKIPKRAIKNRLEQICRIEKIELDAQLFQELSKIQDIRSCLLNLHTLREQIFDKNAKKSPQFSHFLAKNSIKNENFGKKTILTFERFKKLNIGGKDEKANLFDFVKNCFSRKYRSFERQRKLCGHFSNSSAFVVNCFYSNYLKFSGAYFVKSVKMIESIADADLFSKNILISSKYKLPLCSYNINLLSSNNTNFVKLDIPNKENDAKKKIFKEFLVGIKNNFYRANFQSGQILLFDIPFLLKILTPSFNFSSFSKLNQNDFQKIEKTKNLMNDFGLKFISKDANFSLSPEINNLLINSVEFNKNKMPLFIQNSTKNFKFKQILSNFNQKKTNFESKKVKKLENETKNGKIVKNWIKVQIKKKTKTNDKSLNFDRSRIYSEDFFS